MVQDFSHQQYQPLILGIGDSKKSSHDSKKIASSRTTVTGQGPGPEKKKKNVIWAKPKKKNPNSNPTLQPLKIGFPKRKLVFQPSMFRGELLVSGKVHLVWCFPLCDKKCRISSTASHEMGFLLLYKSNSPANSLRTSCKSSVANRVFSGYVSLRCIQKQ